jgi:hypothetical protein
VTPIGRDDARVRSWFRPCAQVPYAWLTVPEIDGPVTGSEARTLGPRAAKLRPADGQAMDVRESRAMPKRLTSAPGQSLSCHGLVFFRPVLWPGSTHFDKFLVERSSEHSDVAVPLPFDALVGDFDATFHWLFRTRDSCTERRQHSDDHRLGRPLCGATPSICTRCYSRRPRSWRRSSKRCRCSATRLQAQRGSHVADCLRRTALPRR